MSDKREQFDNIWDKDAQMKRKILDWLTVRKIEITYENALAYWMGNIKPFKDPQTGATSHLNTRTQWKQISRWRRWGNATEGRKTRNDKSHSVSRHNRQKNRRLKR
jgi:hypothetical protein